MLGATTIRRPLHCRDSTDNYRGGVRFELNRFHVTLEQGGTTFKEDDRDQLHRPEPGRPHHTALAARLSPQHPAAGLRHPRHEPLQPRF